MCCTRQARPRIALRQRLHELERGHLVRLRGQRPVELEESLAQSRTGGGGFRQRALEIGLEIRSTKIAAALQPRDDLLGALRGGVELRPQRRGVECESTLARGERDFSGPPGKSRVACLARHLVVGTRGKRRIAPLQGDVADEQSIHELRRKLAGRAGGRGRAFGPLRDARLGEPMGRDD